jgi:hypothetical protein
MRGFLVFGAFCLAACDKGPDILEVYNMPVAEAANLVPRGLSVCWGLQAGHMDGLRESGLEADIVRSCEQSTRVRDLSDDCRKYAQVAADYGRAALGGQDLDDATDESDAAFSQCVG